MAFEFSFRPAAVIGFALVAALAAGCQSTTRTSGMDRSMDRSSTGMGAAGTGTTSGPGTTSKSGTVGSSPSENAGSNPGSGGTAGGATGSTAAPGTSGSTPGTGGAATR